VGVISGERTREEGNDGGGECVGMGQEGWIEKE
jgi:hypothetical protein